MTNKAQITLLILVAIFFAFVYFRGQTLRKNHILTTAEVIDCNGGGRGNWGPGIAYEYKINGDVIRGSRRHSELKYAIKDLVGHSFPVIYQKSWFGYDDAILITPRDFAYYHVSFPDSLKWISKYIKNK